MLLRYNYKLSIIEDVYNVLKNQWGFAIRVWFGMTPSPPVMVKDQMFTFLWDPSLIKMFV